MTTREEPRPSVKVVPSNVKLTGLSADTEQSSARTERRNQEWSTTAEKNPTFVFSRAPLEGLTDFRITKYGM